MPSNEAVAGAALKDSGERRRPAGKQHQRLGRRDVDGDTFAAPDAGCRQRRRAVQRRPARLAGEAAQDLDRPVPPTGHHAAVAEFDRAERIGRQLAESRARPDRRDHAAARVSIERAMRPPVGQAGR